MNKTIYVATDVDGTLTKENLSYLFGRFLYQNKLISFWASILSAVLYGLHTLGLCSLGCLHRTLFGLLFQGKKRSVIEEAADQFLTLSLPSLFRHEALQELEAWRHKGAVIGLFSSSPEFLIQRVAQTLLVEECFATVYGVDAQGVFSCIDHVMTGEEKAQCVREKRKLFTSIVAMSDSTLDLPLLLEADDPIAVFPSRALAKVAKLKGWRILS